MADGWGGARPHSGGARKGAGRKPKITATIREKALEQANGDAEYALGLFIGMMRDSKNSKSMRMTAAKEIMDRVWGRPTQRAEVAVDAKVEAEVTDARDKVLDLVSRRVTADRESGDTGQDDGCGSGDTSP